MAQGSCHVMGLKHDKSLGEGVCVCVWKRGEVGVGWGGRVRGEGNVAKQLMLTRYR